MRSRRLACSLAALTLLAAAPSSAEVPVQSTIRQLPSSNGHGAILLDLGAGKLHHFREHLFGTEEPQLDASKNEVWAGNQPQVVKTRDVLYDAYFGLRAGGQQGWLTAEPVDLDASGYAGHAAGKKGGTGVAVMVQRRGDLEITQHFFAPQSLEHASFAMVARVKNTGAAKASGVQLFSLHNYHLGFGRPGAMSDIGEEGETIIRESAGGHDDLVERAFAGVVVTRAVGPLAHATAWSPSAPAGQNGYQVVATSTGDLADVTGAQPTADGSASAFQFDLGDIEPGAEAWAGLVAAHHGDPFGDDEVQGWLDGYVGNSDAKSLVEGEIAAWASLQAKVKVPAGASESEEALYRQSAAMLHMGQNREETAYLRDKLTSDADARYTRFDAPSGGAAKLPGLVKHRGKGAMLASLPPGEWTVAWIRDGSYAAAAMAAAGMGEEAKMALSFYLDAEGGRFQTWNELKPYGMPPYQISLVRYLGFGVEETDFNDFGPNLEFDGFGLFLWALRQYEQQTGDTSLADGRWQEVSELVGDVLVKLIDPDTGLIRRDSSIWETHWNGRERAFTYTSLTAARGLCDAAAMAERVGDPARAKTYRDTANALRDAIARKLTDKSRALASNLEELSSGTGHFDAAVIDAIAMGLFDPKGTLAKATFAGLDAHLRAPAGAGWSRNDDRTDHAGGNDLSPWGSEYDSAEWVVTDMRGSVAARLGGDEERAERLLKWVHDQSVANYLEVAETYDENKGTYKFNTPMLGFGAGAFMLALHARDAAPDPACGAYYDESVLPPPEQGQGGAGGGGTAGASQGGAGGEAGGPTAGGAPQGGAAQGGGQQGGSSQAGASQGGGEQGGGQQGGAGAVGEGGSATGPKGGSSPGKGGSSGALGTGAGAGGAAGQAQETALAEPSQPGCGCRTAPARGDGRAALALGLALMAIARRRRSSSAPLRR